MPDALAPLPWRLAYEGAATVEDAAGNTVAECPTPEVAAALVARVNLSWAKDRLGELLQVDGELAALEKELRQKSRRKRGR